MTKNSVEHCPESAPLVALNQKSGKLEMHGKA